MRCSLIAYRRPVVPAVVHVWRFASRLLPSGDACSRPKGKGVSSDISRLLIGKAVDGVARAHDSSISVGEATSFPLLTEFDYRRQ